MSDKPILFSTPMVRALLAGTKTQTRRALNPQPFLDEGSWKVQWGKVLRCWQDGHNPEIIPNWLRIAVGDRLWVRENIAISPRMAWDLPKTGSPDDPDLAAYYQADFDRSGRPRWRPSIHMPRWASRLTLHVTKVRVQRLQEIDEDDAKAEGGTFYVPPNHLSHGGWSHDGHYLAKTARKSYADLWNDINGTKEQPDPWSLNPWVAAYTFEVERCNIAQARIAA